MGDPTDFAAEGLNLLDIGVGVFDRDRRLVFANGTFRALRRYPDEICQPGVTLEALLRFNAERGDFGEGDAGDLVGERLAEIDKSAERSIERKMADGQVLSIRYRRMPSGGLLVTFDDRTAERRAEASLAASEERYALAARVTSDLIYDWDVEANELHVSDMFARFTRFDAEREGPKGWLSGVHPDDREAYVDATRAHLKGETEALDVEYRIEIEPGRYAWLHDMGAGTRGEDGRVTRLVGAVRDITDIKEAKADRDRTEARLASSLETISDGILMIDADNRVQIWNDRYYEIFSEACGGADLSNVIVKDRPFFEMLRDGYNLGMFDPHPDGVDGWIAMRVKAWDDPAMRREMELANGMWILVNERALPDGGRVSVYTDVTELKQRESEAAAARRQFEDAIESISTGFAMFDREDRLLVWNSRFRDYFADVADAVVAGARFRDLLAASVERGVFPAAEGDHRAFLDSVLARRAKGDGQVRENRLANGLWLQISDHRTSDGGLASIYTDVTELKTREQEAQAARERFEVAIEAISTGFALWDAEDRMIVCNSRYRNYFPEMPDKVIPGVTFTEIMSAAIQRDLFPGSARDPKDHLAKALAARARADGSPREQHLANGTWLQITDHRTRDGGLVSIYADVTESKRREAELEAAVQEFNVVVETINYGVLFVGPDLHTRLANRAFLEYWHISPDVINSKPHLRELIELNRDSGFYDIAPDQWDDWLDNRVATVKAGDIPPTEVRRADGSVMSYQCVALPDGGRMLTYFDITELKARETESALARDKAEAALEDLRKAQERLVQAEKMASLGQLTAGIAHEIKNPLNFVNNFAKLADEMLEELGEILEAPIAALEAEVRDDAEDLFKTVRENLGKINEHGRRADSIVKNMLLHSREGPSERQVSNLNAIADEALNLAYHGARAENPAFNIEMVKSLSPDVGDVECFPQDLMRVFLNLITNGMYAANKRAKAEEGIAPTIAVSTRVEHDRIEIEVRDNGAGIAPEVLEKIFTPFFTTKPAGEGTGLGLSLSYDIVVKQHGGELNVNSNPGEFTAFCVTLPRNLPASGGDRP